MVKTKLRCAGASDPGRVRRNNEDAWHIDAERGIFLVVDGIGGQNAGEKAAEIAVDRVRARLERQTGTVEQRIREAITMANNEIVRAAQSNPEWQGMACVLTLAVLDNGSAVIGHVGDSRLYLLRRGSIRKLTRDHSPVGEREDGGELNESEAMRHPRRNEVYRDVGSEEHSPADSGFVDVERVPFEADAALLLCSDGLSDLVPSTEIRRIVERHAGDPQAAVQELIAAANTAGGKDNVTVVVVEGERFSPAVPEPEPAASRSNLFASRPALFLYGVLLALSAAWFTRDFWTPEPRVTGPTVWQAGNGTQLDIAEAIRLAAAGDTVEVAGGEYRQQVRLKDGVALRSRGPREAILRAAPEGNGPAVVAENVHGARLTGFRILADPGMPLTAGILLINSQVDIDDNEIAGAGVGLEIRGGASSSVRGNSIHDSAAEGILITGPSAPWLSHNALQRNGGAPVAARDGANPALMGNVFDKAALELPPTIAMDTVRAHNIFVNAARPVRQRPARPATAEAKQ